MAQSHANYGYPAKVAYLIVLHCWTFVILFFHAHGFDSMHRDDFGTLPHGPQALVENAAPNVLGLTEENANISASGK